MSKMNYEVSDNTKAILLLTAPLILGRSKQNHDLLKPREYQQLARCLWDAKLQPADLLRPEASQHLELCQAIVDKERLIRLMARGFLLSQVLERWHARSIWVISRADALYPSRFKSRLRDESPALLYGCGDISLIDNGGLAVVGSRNVGEELFSYTIKVGQLSAKAGKAIISGGAKGIDQAAMIGSLESGGKAVGVLAENLEKVSVSRGERNHIVDGRLVLISAYDPASGFNVGHAMQRNKLIYALADTSLVVNSDINKGGTWAGAIEQLNKFKFAPLYVRSTGERSTGLEALMKNGALPWPEPNNIHEFEMIFNESKKTNNNQTQPQLDLLNSSTFEEHSLDNAISYNNESNNRVNEELKEKINNRIAKTPSIDKVTADILLSRDLVEASAIKNAEEVSKSDKSMADKLFTEVKILINQLLVEPMKDNEVALALDITKIQAKKWLQRLVDSGVLKIDDASGLYTSADNSEKIK